MKFEVEKGRAQSIPGIRDLVENDLFLLLERGSSSTLNEAKNKIPKIVYNKIEKLFHKQKMNITECKL